MLKIKDLKVNDEILFTMDYKIIQTARVLQVPKNHALAVKDLNDRYHVFTNLDVEASIQVCEENSLNGYFSTSRKELIAYSVKRQHLEIDLLEAQRRVITKKVDEARKGIFNLINNNGE